MFLYLAAYDKRLTFIHHSSFFIEFAEIPCEMSAVLATIDTYLSSVYHVVFINRFAEIPYEMSSPDCSVLEQRLLNTFTQRGMLRFQKS